MHENAVSPEAGGDESIEDLSFLNALDIPAGRRGFLRAVGGKLEFADGTTARFWGTNLTAHALFGTSRESVRRHAKRLSRLGFNLVRLHHHDSPWVRPNIFGDGDAGNTGRLEPRMLEALDWWIKCLIDEGIYVWLDLHVQRHLEAGDRILDFDEIRDAQGRADLRGYNYVNASIRRAMQRFNQDYVDHRNRFTGRRYRDEPAIVAMLVTNENDVTAHFASRLLPKQRARHHSLRYMRASRAFAEAAGLPPERAWRSWEHGPSKLFLNDLEYRFHASMISHLRSLGVRVPIAATSTWGSNPLSSLPALTAGTLVDVHAYGREGVLARNPHHEPNLVHWLAAAQVAGKPLTVSEWNVEPFPLAERHAMPLYIAASASHQGWHAVMQYAYTVEALNGPGTASNWHAFNDAALLSTLPAAALLYRRGYVREASTVYAFAPGEDVIFARTISPANSVALRTAAERGRLLIAMPGSRYLPWLEPATIPAGANVIASPDRSLIEPGANVIASDTGELKRYWRRGVFTIDAPKTQAAMGVIGGGRIRLADVEIAVKAASATVAVQSLDGKPIRESRRILVSLGAPAVPRADNRPPFRSEPLEGNILVRAPAGLSLFAQGGRRPANGAKAEYQRGRYRIELVRFAGNGQLVLR